MFIMENHTQKSRALNSLLTKFFKIFTNTTTSELIFEPQLKSSLLPSGHIHLGDILKKIYPNCNQYQMPLQCLRNICADWVTQHTYHNMHSL